MDELETGLIIYHLENPADLESFRIVAVNKMFTKIFQDSFEIILGTTIYEIIPDTKYQLIPDAKKIKLAFKLMNLLQTNQSENIGEYIIEILKRSRTNHWF